MVGVCAGWREEAQLGDVIVAERLFRYDGGKLRAWTEGTERLEAVFHDIRTYNLDPRWRQRAEDFSHEWASAIRLHARPIGYRTQELWLLEAFGDAERGVGKHPRDRDDRAAECPDWTGVVASSLSDLTFGPLISLAFFKFGRNTIPNDINFLRRTKRSSPTNC